MGYDIRPISELNTYDYSQCTGVQNKNTVRKSIDGTLFIVEGDNINAYTQAEMLEITNTDSRWINEI